LVHHPNERPLIEGAFNRMLRIVFYFKTQEVTGDWRKIHNKKLSNLYFPQHIIKMVPSRMRWTEHAEVMEEMNRIGSCQTSDNPLGSTKGKEFLNYLSNC
jgi:hypothetical protein